MKKSPTFKKSQLSSIIWYEFRILRKRSEIWSLAITSAFFIPSAGSRLFHFTEGIFSNRVISISLILGTLSICWSVYKIYGAYFKKGSYQVVPSLTHQKQVTEMKSPLGSDMEKVMSSDGMDGFFHSLSTNTYLRTNATDIALEIKNEHRTNLIENLRENSNNYCQYLRCHFRAARSAGKMFFNETKIGLASDLVPSVKVIDVYKTDYFSSFLTNELFWFDFQKIDRNGHSLTLHRGNQVRCCTANHLNLLEGSSLSNHIGGNILGISSDGYLALWTQGATAMFSSRKAAPTGSGSLDWSDLSEGDSLYNLILKGMLRELGEESSKEGARIQLGLQSNLLITGYFRWAGRAGLPGFTGVARLNQPLNLIHPNRSEVVNDKDIISPKPVPTLTDLNNEISKYLKEEARRHLSIPLLACLIHLKQAIAECPDLVSQTLYGQG